MLDHLLAHGSLFAKRLKRARCAGMVEQVERPQRAVGHAQRIPHRGRAAGHGHVGEVREPLERRAIRQQHFPAPDGAVRSVARSVERDAAHRPFQSVLAQNGGDVRMVMLHLRKRQTARAAALARPLRRKVLGMQVASEQGGCDLEQRLVAALGRKPRVVRLGVFHVADVLRHERLGIARERERVLLLGPCGEHGVSARRGRRSTNVSEGFRSVGPFRWLTSQ